MMKTKITRISKRTLSMVLALLMILSVIGFGSIITVIARNGSTMYVCVSDATMASNDANEVWVNVKQNEQSNQNNWTSAEMESSNKFYNGKRIYKIVGVEDTTWGGLGALQIQLKKDGTWKAQKEPKANNGSWWSSSNYANKLYNYDSGSFVATYAEATHANGFTAGDYYIHNNVNGAWYGNGTSAPQMTKSGSIYYYDFYLKKNEVDTSNYLIFKFWDSSDSLQIGPDYESDHRCTLSTSDSWSSTVQSIQNYGDKDTAWQVNTSGFTTDKFNRVRITFDPTTLANSRNGRVKFTKTELADMDPTFSTTSFTKGTSYNLTSLVGVTSGSNAGTVSYSTYQYYDTSWHTISSPASWTPSATNITKLRVTATDGGVITTAGTTKNAVTARTETKETAITVSLATHTVSRSSAPSNGTLQLSSDNSTWGTSALTVAEGSNYYVKATPNTGYKINTLTVAGSTITDANNSTSAYTHTGTMSTSNVTTSCTFSPQSYSITYKDQGDVAFSGTHASGYPTSHTYGTATTLKTATKTGYTFGGWYTSSDCSGSAVTSLGATAYTDNITLYAKWTLKSYSITLSESGTTGGVLKVDGSVASTATHGSHTLRVDAPAGYEISSISSTGATWTNHETYATSTSVSITGAYTISVTYVKSANPALKVDYTGAGGTTYTTTNGDSVTTSTRHNVTATFTNQSSFDNGTSYSWNYKRGSTTVSSGSGTTSSSGGNITLKSAGKLTTADTYVFSITVGTKTTSITVIVNTPRTLTVSSVSNTTVSGTYTDEFGQTSQTISAAGTYYCKTRTTYSVTYTADSNYCFSDSDNTQTTKTYSGTISAAVTTTPTVYEKKYTLTINKSVAGSTTKVDDYTVKPVTGTNITAPTETYYTLSNYTVTSGSVTVNGTSYATNSTIPAGNLTAVKATANATIRANFTENSFTLTINQKKGSGTATNKTTQTVKPVTTSTVSAWTVTGYTITGWTVTSGTVYVNGTAYAANSTINTAGDLSSVTIRAAATIQANFTETTHTVTVQSAAQNSVALGNVSPASGSAGIDTALSISAEAKTGYEFVNWTGSNLTFANSNSASTSVTASADGTATANFRRTRLYLDVSANSTWKGASYYKAYFFQNGSPYTTGTTNGFISMTAVDGVENLYYVDLPGTFNTLSSNYGFIFIAKTDNNNDWNNKTAQTADLTFDQQKNKYVIGASSNSWNASPYFPPRTYSVIVNAAEHGTVGGVTSQTVQVPDEGTAYTLPTPQASYGYKFTGWEVVSGSVNYNNTTYTSGVFSTNATTAITANQASTVRANFDYNDNMNLYIVGRFRVYNTYTGSPRTATYVGGSSGAWSTTATNIKFQYNSDGHYYYVDTNSSIAELSASLSDKQYFRVYDQSNTKNWQLSADQALTEANEATHYTMTLSGDKSFYFNETSNSNGPVKVCFDPVTNKLWFTIPARHTASVGTITTSPHAGTSPGYTGAGGTITVNNSSSATVSEGTNYAIKVTPTAGYKLTALAVNGNSIISGHENATSEFTINRAMGTGGSTYAETITATFTAISYSISVSDNSSGNGGTIKYKKNGGTATATTGSATVEDRIQPVVTVNRTSGYKLTTVQLKNGSNVTQAVLTNNGTEFEPSYSVYGMKAYDSKLEANYAAITPVLSNISTTTQGVSVSGYTVNAYAGQTIAITPAVTSTSYGVISYESGSMNMVSGVDNATKTQSGNTFTVTIPKNIGPNASSTAQYTFTITPKNSPAGVSAVTGTAQTITINVSYSGTPATNGAQQAYMNLKTKYDEYAGYEITSDDIESGWSDFNSAMTTANTALGTFPNSIPEWNASDSYTAKKTALETAYSNLVFKETTIYVLSKYEHSNSSYVNIYLFNNSTATHDPSPIFYTDTSLTTINNTARNYHMTYEGETNDHKHLYSFTYRGHQEFIIYRRSSETDTLTDGAKLTGDIDLRNTTNYPYGEYYIDVKNTDVTSSPSVTSASTFTDFSISATGADSDLMVGQCKEGATGYTVSQIQSWLGITFNGSLASTSSQTVAQTYTITGPVGRGVPTEATVDSDHNWVPLKPGRYTVSLNASLGTDERASAGATFTGSKSTVGDTQTVLDLFVAFDDIEIYADMNGNVGTPTIHFTYTDNQGQDADLPYEFDMVTGSESIYSYTISVSTLRDVYHIDLLNGAHTETVGGETITYRAAQVSKISIDSVDIENSSFSIARDAARTGTLWLKADSSNMKTFNKIAYGSSTRTFKAVLRNGNTDTDFNNTFAEVNGTGIITDELVGDSYQYTSFYAAKDATANYDFSYTLRAKAETDITHKDGNTTNYYYFDHWESINGTTTNTNPAEASGTDVNILKAPNYATDADVTYVAVYKLTSIQKRVEITYKFKDYDTDDENYVYDPDKPLKDATYTKTVNWDGTTALSTVARNSCPIIKSNYFDYTFDASTANVTTTQSEDPNTHKTCITAELKQTPHKYKIILGSTTHKGYYQQSVTLTAAGSNYKWYVKDANNNKIFIGNGQTYNARFGVYQDAGSETESGVSYQYDICTIYNESGTAAINSSIVPAHQEVYYDNDTPKVRHNFFIIDAYDNSGEFVGAGVLYATTDSSGNYRQSNAATVLGSTNSVNTNGISNFITGVLNPNNNINTAKYNTEFKAQTINNIGFRYLPYSGNESILRYSNELKAYMYTFAGENTNSASMQGQKLRVFSFFVYKNGNTYTNVVSNMYAQVERYIPQS